MGRKADCEKARKMIRAIEREQVSNFLDILIADILNVLAMLPLYSAFIEASVFTPFIDVKQSITTTFLY